MNLYWLHKSIFFPIQLKLNYFPIYIKLFCFILEVYFFDFLFHVYYQFLVLLYAECNFVTGPFKVENIWNIGGKTRRLNTGVHFCHSFLFIMFPYLFENQMHFYIGRKWFAWYSSCFCNSCYPIINCSFITLERIFCTSVNTFTLRFLLS